MQSEGGEKDETSTSTENQKNRIEDGESERDKSIVNKFFVHSQWLAVQSPYFKALFYSGMKETYSKEVIMKIYECELEAHKALIEAMYKLDALNDKDYRLVVQVLVLAHKYDVRLLIKKCKYVLLSTTPSLEMCEYILKEISHLSDIADIHEMLEKFLLKEFTPIDDTWTLEKFTSLSEAALRLLLKSDNLGTRSENTIFVALMKWVRTNISWYKRMECDLLGLVRFEFMSVNFLYDIVRNDFSAQRMPGFNDYLLKGLAYHSFSEIRREQLKPKPKERLAGKADEPTFSWVIDEKMEGKLSNSLGDPLLSDIFWYQGYSMQLRISYLEDCDIFLRIIDLPFEACLCVSFTAKSILFASGKVEIEKALFTGESRGWGQGNVRKSILNRIHNGYTIDVWVKII